MASTLQKASGFKARRWWWLAVDVFWRGICQHTVAQRIDRRRRPTKRSRQHSLQNPSPLIASKRVQTCRSKCSKKGFVWNFVLLSFGNTLRKIQQSSAVTAKPAAKGIIIHQCRKKWSCSLWALGGMHIEPMEFLLSEHGERAKIPRRYMSDAHDIFVVVGQSTGGQFTPGRPIEEANASASLFESRS